MCPFPGWSITSYRLLLPSQASNSAPENSRARKPSHAYSLSQNDLTTPTSKFRHTISSPGAVPVTEYKLQPTSRLSDPSCHSAQITLDRRHAYASRWVRLYAFPKAFLSKSDTPYPLPWPYPARPRQSEQRSGVFDWSVTLRPALRTKIKRRIKEAVRLIVTRRAVVEESSCGAHQESCSVPRTPAQKSRFCLVRLRCDVTGKASLSYQSAEWAYIAVPHNEMFRMPFPERLGLMHKVLGSIHRRIPTVEETLRNSRHQASQPARKSIRTRFKKIENSIQA